MLFQCAPVDRTNRLFSERGPRRVPGKKVTHNRERQLTGKGKPASSESSHNVGKSKENLNSEMQSSSLHARIRYVTFRAFRFCSFAIPTANRETLIRMYQYCL